MRFSVALDQALPVPEPTVGYGEVLLQASIGYNPANQYRPVVSVTLQPCRTLANGEVEIAPQYMWKHYVADDSRPEDVQLVQQILACLEKLVGNLYGAKKR